jgi:hypothetical protein
MGKRRAPDIVDDNPLTEDFLEWMLSPDGQAAGEVSGLVFATLEDASDDRHGFSFGFGVSEGQDLRSERLRGWQSVSE